ncbi:MAG TPA: helix-turn-helix domain-containing protein [Candidatus Nanoarchaeia archaeon]|nr:helix-turn-helix domain-containing protein [Candidatus Nanoarchaeia archaeon]
MAPRITEETRAEIRRLYNTGAGLSMTEIANLTGVSYSTAYKLTRLEQRINPETGQQFSSYGEYQTHLARQRASHGEHQDDLARRKGFSSSGEHQDDLARRKGFSSRGEYQTHLAKQKGFSSRGEYQTHLAKQKGFASHGEYLDDLAKQKGFSSRGEYKDDLAKRKGFSSGGEYEDHLARQRQERPQNQELSDLIKKRLKELGQNQTWLSQQMGVSRQAVSYYVQGKVIPKGEHLPKLYSALEVPYNTLDDLLLAGS